MCSQLFAPDLTVRAGHAWHNGAGCIAPVNRAGRPKKISMTEPLSLSIEPSTVEVLIETPRGSFAKRDARGAVEFFSPLPCPFNYGCVPGCAAADGDALDAVVLGPRRPFGQRVQILVRATVLFIDAGQQDDKLICSTYEVSATERRLVLAFFHFYALCKRIANRALRRGGPTRCLGWRDTAPQPAAASV